MKKIIYSLIVLAILFAVVFNVALATPATYYIEQSNYDGLWGTYTKLYPPYDKRYGWFNTDDEEISVEFIAWLIPPHPEKYEQWVWLYFEDVYIADMTEATLVLRGWDYTLLHDEMWMSIYGVYTGSFDPIVPEDWYSAEPLLNYKTDAKVVWNAPQNMQEIDYSWDVTEIINELLLENQEVTEIDIMLLLAPEPPSQFCHIPFKSYDGIGQSYGPRLIIED